MNTSRRVALSFGAYAIAALVAAGAVAAPFPGACPNGRCCPGGICRPPLPGAAGFGAQTLLPSFAPAATSGQTPHPAVVRVIAPDRDGMSLGSGTLIYVTERHGLVITNWHVVRDAVGPVEVAFPDGFRSAGTVIKTDNNWDLAAIGIWKPRAAPVELAPVAPLPGEALTIAGYGGGSYRAASGRCMQYVSPGSNHPFQIIELSAEARQGDSGGPIFNGRGQLSGVLLGAGSGRTVGSYCGRVGMFLADVTPLLDSQRGGEPGNGSREMIAQVPPASRPSPPRAQAGYDAASSAFAGQGVDDRVMIPVPSPSRAVESEVAVGGFAGGGMERAAAEPSPSAALRPDLSSPSDWSAPPAVRTPLAAAGSFGAADDGRLTWDDLVGRTRGEQAKSLLAAIGAVAILFCSLRVLLVI